MATKSMPTVSCLPAIWATFSFVPTPSVPLTSSGSAMSLAAAMENRPPKPPMSPTTSGRYVSCTTPLMASTARAPSAVSTPAWAYVTASSSIQLGMWGPPSFWAALTLILSVIFSPCTYAPVPLAPSAYTSWKSFFVRKLFFAIASGMATG